MLKPPEKCTKAQRRIVEMRVNDVWRHVTVQPRHALIEILRETLGLAGTKDGCEQGTCGACTVLIDGQPALACLTLATECDGKDIQTVEGLAEGGKISAIQQAFLDQGAVQCGFCTPGMLMSITALLRDNPKPSVPEIKKALEGNLCRCTGYNAIVAAILQVSDQGVLPITK
ncbi:MAG TPA: (2Fe-2S)-binding protein [Burkholderiaceae bacterium]|nr:(2Fe-2S)-binding protein [Burkholderiaceae bacterium]